MLSEYSEMPDPGLAEAARLVGITNPYLYSARELEHAIQVHAGRRPLIDEIVRMYSISPENTLPSELVTIVLRLRGGDSEEAQRLLQPA